ncbi:Ubiquitin-60S ribosomal protein L40 [Tetrabaena socialis]|uniref:Ubiquitin-60S ribosomal protein L40 n=1 Tax=Tetrabaena socialis TaxID=47790 RepID=A0A2J8AAV8_9CHLO|nr:Ubiquitin-60S ribosomal protein L40 [Tetrabaena socialis]|eukprot:PNH09661.1 Ubiquitin-60S ribosomal protein L40 [Tetrabaena socialis]
MSDSIQIKIKDVSGTKSANDYLLNVPRSSSIAWFKERIQDLLGIPPIDQEIIFEGKGLCVGTLADNGVDDQATIYVWREVRAGMFHATSGRAGYKLPPGYEDFGDDDDEVF